MFNSMLTWIDIGSDHQIAYYAFSPDRDLNPQYADIPDYPHAGIMIRHNRPDGVECGDTSIPNWCSGSLIFDLPGLRDVFRNETDFWTVEQEDPLTIAPSVLCRCGDHGYIIDGAWQPA